MIGNPLFGGGLIQNVYVQIEGNGNFSDLVDLIKIINMTDTPEKSFFDFTIESISMRKCIQYYFKKKSIIKKILSYDIKI